MACHSGTSTCSSEKCSASSCRLNSSRLRMGFSSIPKICNTSVGFCSVARNKMPPCHAVTTAIERPLDNLSCKHYRRRAMSPAMTMAPVVLLLALIGAELRIAGAQEMSDSSTELVDDGSRIPLWQTLGEYLLIILLVAASGLFSGLTLGLLGLDKIGLEIISNGDEPRMAAFAKKIQPVRADGNLLLCTLLLGNVSVNALLSIVMAKLTSGLVGFALATVIITIFGEIIPQAVCSRHALRIGSCMVPLVRAIIMVLYPVTKPLSLVLDKMLGNEIGTIHSRTELTELLKIHVQHGALDVETGREIAGAMNYKERTVRDVMTPAKDCFMLSVSEKLNFKTLSVIFKSGFSRIPVFGKDRNDVIGLLFTKDLIFIDPDDETPLNKFVQIFGRAVTLVWPDYALGDVLKVFKQGKSHMGLVRDVNSAGEGDPFYEVVGIITLEDIIEEILGDEIVDETDAFVDVETQLPVERREFDMNRLQLLNSQADTSSLSVDEAKAVSSYLVANVPQLKHMEQAHVQAIIASSPVVNIAREVSQGTRDPAPPEVLYRRGRTSAVCTLILTGKVVVVAGKDEFQSDAGPWSILAADALVEDEGAYKPDFSAHVGSEHLRCIRISKATFDSITSFVKHDRGENGTPALGEGRTGYSRSNAINGRHTPSSDKDRRSGGVGVVDGEKGGTSVGRSKDRMQGRSSPGARAMVAIGQDSPPFKIGQTMTVSSITLDPGEEPLLATEEEENDVPEEDVEEIVAMVGGGHQSHEANGVATPNSNYTLADSTEPDSGHIA